MNFCPFVITYNSNFWQFHLFHDKLRRSLFIFENRYLQNEIHEDDQLFEHQEMNVIMMFLLLTPYRYIFSIKHTFNYIETIFSLLHFLS